MVKARRPVDHGAITSARWTADRPRGGGGRLPDPDREVIA